MHHADDSRRPKRYFPFAEGPRSCVGQSLAKVSLVATMATLLSRFSFRLADEVRPLQHRLQCCASVCPRHAVVMCTLHPSEASLSVKKGRGAFLERCRSLGPLRHDVMGYSPSSCRSWLHSSRALIWKHAVQMGGPEGVLKRERYTLVIGLKGGMYMHAVPRIPISGTDGQASSTTTSDEDC